jgi:hypothetical protein
MVYCGLCGGWGVSIPEVRYVFEFGCEWFKVVTVGPGKDCPGCDGTGVSEKAKRLMAEQEKQDAQGR